MCYSPVRWEAEEQIGNLVLSLFVLNLICFHAKEMVIRKVGIKGPSSSLASSSPECVYSGGPGRGGPGVGGGGGGADVEQAEIF